MSASPAKISAYIQDRLRGQGLDEVTPKEAARWLDRAGLLTDYAPRPGMPLRKLLRAGLIDGAVKSTPGRSGLWTIRRVD